jgi:vacuolar-type H+-ATPase catalytic subunit A/Vma1
VEKGAVVKAGQYLGSVPEGLFRHHIMVPLSLHGTWEITDIRPRGLYRVSETIAIRPTALPMNILTSLPWDCASSLTLFS